MSGLGGLNKSPNGVVIGLVQLQLPVVATPADLAKQTETIVAMVGKARRNMPTMDLVVFPEYALHGLSMDTNPAIMCSLDGPEVAAFRKACVDNAIWGCFSLMEKNPAGNPYNSGIIVTDKGEIALYYRKLHPWVPVEPWHPSDHRTEGCEDRAYYLSRRHVPGNGARGRLQGRRDHAAHGGLHRADPRILALHQPVERVLQPDGHRQCVHVRLRRHVRFDGGGDDRQLRRHHPGARHLRPGQRDHHCRGAP